MLITALLLLPLVGALAIALLPGAAEQQCRHLGLCFSLLTFFVSLGLLFTFSYTTQPASALTEEQLRHYGGMQGELAVPWVKSLGLSYHVGIDGISLWLVLLTTLLTPLVMLGAYQQITTKVREFVICMLLLELGMLGAFVALDLILFYVFWEVMLVPMYLIIGIWGHERKTYAALKFVIYTMAGSLLMLVAILYLYVTHGQATGEYTFDYLVLKQSVWAPTVQLYLYAGFALAFAIKVPLFPLHTWLPDAHVEAPTAGSVILAGVLLKLGTYGLLRFAIPLFPWAAAAFAPYLALLAVVGIIYGALVAYMQEDAKKLVAYSSVSHLGFVVLGLMAMTVTGIQGSLFQMLSHGLATGGLFLAIGVLYDRRHTRQLAQFGGLWRRMPVFGGIFLVIMLASAGLPGLCGFVGEFLILVGTFTHESAMQAWGVKLADGHALLFILHPRLLAALATMGLVLGALYLLHLFQKLMFGPLTHPKNQQLSDLSARELATFAPLLVLVVLLGLHPQPFLQRMEPTTRLLLAEYRHKLASSLQEHGAQPLRLAVLRPLRGRAAPPTRGPAR